MTLAGLYIIFIQNVLFQELTTELSLSRNHTYQVKNITNKSKVYVTWSLNQTVTDHFYYGYFL